MTRMVQLLDSWLVGMLEISVKQKTGQDRSLHEVDVQRKTVESKQIQLTDGTDEWEELVLGQHDGES